MLKKKIPISIQDLIRFTQYICITFSAKNCTSVSFITFIGSMNEFSYVFGGISFLIKNFYASNKSIPHFLVIYLRH